MYYTFYIYIVHTLYLDDILLLKPYGDVCIEFLIILLATQFLISLVWIITIFRLDNHNFRSSMYEPEIKDSSRLVDRQKDSKRKTFIQNQTFYFHGEKKVTIIFIFLKPSLRKRIEKNTDRISAFQIFCKIFQRYIRVKIHTHCLIIRYQGCIDKLS